MNTTNYQNQIDSSLNLLILNGIITHKSPKPENILNIKNYNPQILNETQKISDVKKEVIESRTQDIKELITKLFSVENKTHSSLIQIHDKILVSNIMNVYLDEENRIILNCLKKPMTIQEIVKICKTSLSSTYRRISFLLENGCLRISGYKKEIGKKSKSAKFEKIIQNITIHIDENANLVILNIREDIIKENKFRFMMQK